MKEFSRWYDKITNVNKMLLTFKNMSDRELNVYARVLFNVVNDNRAKSQNSSDLSSIGPDKIQAYLKSYNQRRWYDKNPNLRDSIRLLSILSPAEAEMIVDDFLFHLKIEGLTEVYERNRAK